MNALRTCMAAATSLALAFSLSACGSTNQNSSSSSPAASSDSATHYPLTVTTYDKDGNAVETTYNKAPEKVVAVYQGSIETMIALGLEDHVVASFGLDNEVKPEWKDGFAKMNYHEETFKPDKEMITVLQPDMILSWGSLFGDKTLGPVQNWIDQGINTYINTNTRQDESPRVLENEYSDILNIGKIFNVEDRAQKLVDEMKERIASTKKSAEGKQAPSVMVVEPIKDSITNYGKDTLAGDLVTQLGGTLASPDASKVGNEDILAADPDVIFVVYMAYSGDDPEKVKKEQMDIIAANPALASLKAVKNGNVHLVMLGDMYAAGPRTMDGIATFADGMYPSK